MIPPMRRLARRLFTLCSALSLLLCVGVCVLWVRSYRTQDVLYAGPPERQFCAYAAGGLLDVSTWRYEGEMTAEQAASRRVVHVKSVPFDPADGHAVDLLSERATARLRLGDFRYLDLDGAFPTMADFVVCVVPLWLPAVALSTAPATWLGTRLRKRRRGRARVGLCPACGYDLRASPGRCPECGAAAQTVTMSCR